MVLKKLISILLTLTLSYVQISSFAYDEQDSVSQIEDTMPDIISYVYADGDAVISRGEFADSVMRAMNVNNYEYEPVFSDVSEEHAYSGAITYIYKMNFAGGSGADTFSPDSPITYAAAIKILVNALGYNPWAEAKGGWPSGYFWVADTIELTDGMVLSMDSELTFSQAFALLYNFLKSDVCSVESITNDNITHMRDVGRCPLNVYFGLKKAEGVVQTAGFASLIPGVKCDEAIITVDGYTYYTDIADAHKYLGMRVELWYDEYGTAKYVYKTSGNSRIVISSEDIKEYNDFKLNVYSGNKEKTYTLSKDCAFVKNGEGIIPTAADFNFDMGSVELIDNDGDSRFDVAYIKNTEIFVVSAIDETTEKVYDGRSGKSVKLSNEDGNYYSLMMIDKSGNYVPQKIGDLTGNTVLSIIRTSDDRFVEAVASNKSVVGIVSEISDVCVWIDGVEYERTPHFDKYYSVKIGEKYNFLITDSGKIAAISEQAADSMNYGFVLDYAKKTGSFENSAIIKLMDSSGEKIVYSLAEKVMLNGGAYISGDSDEIKNIMKNGDIPAYQVIRYSLNRDGEINKIDTAEKFPANTPGNEKYKALQYGDNSLIQNFEKANTYWYGSYSVFSPVAVKDSETIIISIPKTAKDGINSRIDDEYIDVVTASGLKSYGQYFIDVYDMDENMVPNVIVVYNEYADSNTVKASTSSALVDKMTKGYNDDGEEGTFITVWIGGVFRKYFIEDSEYANLTSSGVVPAPGDIVRIETTKNGRVSALSVDAKYDRNEGVAMITSSAPAGGQVEESCYRGRAYSYSGNSLSLIVDQMSGSQSGYIAVQDKMAPFVFASSTRIAIFDTKTERVRHATVSSLKYAYDVGEENASKVVLRCYSHRATQLFIYE